MYLLGVADLRASSVGRLPGELLELPTDPAPIAAWWTLAACRGMPTNLWFPTRGDHFSAPLARAICAVCPVADECLESARAEEELVNVKFTFGIRGGLSAAQRATSSTRPWAFW